MRRLTVATVVLLAALAPARAGSHEVAVLAGGMDVVGTRDTSYAWQLEYRQAVRGRLRWSVAWLNEGHPPGHHRDGFAISGWITDRLWDDRVEVGVGAGPYRFFDTVRAADGGPENLDAWGGLLSFSASVRLDRRRLLRFTAARTFTGRDIETHVYVAGLGWELAPSPPEAVRPRGAPRPLRRTVEQELMVFGGQSIVNTFRSPGAFARGVEYRRGISPHVDWTMSWINEGRPGPTERDGLAAQAWLENGFHDERLVLGFGAGPYLYSDKEKPEIDAGGDRYGVASVVTISTGWRFGKRWFTRLNWNRVVSFYDRDADVIVLGFGAGTSLGW